MGIYTATRVENRISGEFFEQHLNPTEAMELWLYECNTQLYIAARLHLRRHARPIPLIVSQTLPFERRIGQCSHNPKSWEGRAITLNLPACGGQLIADNGTLLHEMLHQYLFERGEDPAHAGEPWRREIMRLTKLITGKTIWAGPSKTVRQNGKAIRINAPHPETKEVSLPQAIIARWPHNALGINLGFLGQSN
jgi:hypothetical protein